MVRKRLIAFSILSVATTIIFFSALTPLDLESTLNAWYGFGANRNGSLQPVSFFGIPVFAPFLGLGVRLPLLSGITNSPLAWIAPNLSISSLQLGIIAIGLISVIVCLYFTIIRVNPNFSSIYFGILILVILSTSWFYTFVNDWTEIAVGYLGMIHLFLGVTLLFNPYSGRTRSRVNELTGLFILGKGFFMVSLTHVGYMPAIIYPFLFFVLTLKPLKKIMLLSKSTKLSIALFGFLFLLKQTQIFEEINVSEVDNLRNQSITGILSTIIQGSFFAFDTNFTSRAIVLPIGFIFAAGLLLKVQNINKGGGSPDFRVTVGRSMWLTSLFSILLIFVNNLGFLPSASQNWLFRDVAVMTGLSSWVFLHRRSMLVNNRLIIKFIPLCAGMNALALLFFFGNLMVGSTLHSTRVSTPAKSNILLTESIEGAGQRILYDFNQWNYLFNTGSKKLDPREIYSNGYSSITGWPKMRGSMPLMVSSTPLEGKIDKLNCDTSLLQFIQVSWVVTKFRCDIPIKNEFPNGIKIYENNSFFVLKILKQGLDVPNCALFNSNCLARIVQLGKPIISAIPQISTCNSVCAYSLDFILQPNSAYILPIKFDEQLKFKELGPNSSLNTFQIGSLLGVSNSEEATIKGADLYYYPSDYQLVSIIASLALFFLLAAVGVLLIMRYFFDLISGRRKVST